MNYMDSIELYLGFDKIEKISKFCETYGISRSVLYKKIKVLEYGIHTIDINYLQITIVKDLK